MPHPGFIEYEATVAYSDGSLARRRFWWWPAASEAELKGRAYDIWSLARWSDRSRITNPSLKVAPVAVELEDAA